MKQNINIEAEGSELILKNKAGDYVIIPKKYRLEVQDMIKDNCHNCIDKLVETLPVMEDYALDGSLYPSNTKVKVNQNNQIKEYDISSKGYSNLYNSGKLMGYNKNTDTYIATPLKEATITAEAPQWLKYKRDYEETNPKSNYINSYLTPFAKALGNTKTNYPKRLDEEYEQKSLDYVSEQLVKNKPQGKLSRAEWLNQMSDKEEELIKRNPKYQSSLWADTKRGLTSLVEQNPLQAFQNILNSSDYTNREKQEMLKDYAYHPVMSKLGDATKILNPLTVPSKMTQSTYKNDYSFTDALKGKKNNAGIVEDIVTDPLNLVGAGLLGKISKADKVIDATKAGGKSATSLIKKGVESTNELLNKSVQNVYKINPLAFKPNPEAYYRVGDGKEFIDDVLRTNKIRVYNKNSYANLRETGKISGIREDGKIVLKAKTFPVADTYWSKGVPLDGRFSSQKYGDYMIEASDDIPFIQAVNQKTKQRGFWDAPDVNYNSTHAKGSYVKPRQSYGYDAERNIKPSIGTPLEYNPEFIKLYRPHWLKGYKEIKVPKKQFKTEIDATKAGSKVLNKTDDVIKPTIYNEGENKILDFFTPKNTKKAVSEFTFENIPDRKFNTLDDFKTKYKSNYQVTTDKRTFKGEPLDATKTGKEESNYFTRNVDDKIEKHYNNEITLQKFKDYGGDEKSFQTLIDNINTPSKTVPRSLNNASGLLTDEGVSLAVHNKYLDSKEAMQTLFHEKGHQSKIVASTKEESLLPNLWEDISKLSGYSRYTSADKGSIGMYMNHPSEIYSRIMELKYKANLKPYENFTKELLEKIGGVERDASGKIKKMSGLMPSSYSKNEELWLKLINKAPVLIPAIGSGMYLQSQNQNKNEQ